MLTKNQLKILNAFTSNLFKRYSSTMLKSNAKEKSNNAFSLAIKQFIKEDLIKKRIVGRSNLYKVNLESNLLLNYIEIINENKLTNKVKKSIKVLQREIEKHELFYSLVVFGSFANNKQNKNSDLDLAIIIKDKKDKKNINMAITSAKYKSLIKLDVHIITKDELLEMLNTNIENLGKEISRKHIAINNISLFYKTIAQAKRRWI